MRDYQIFQYSGANPMLHGDGSGGVYNTDDAEREMSDPDAKVPYYMAAILIGGAGLLFALRKSGFELVGTARASSRGG